MSDNVSYDKKLNPPMSTSPFYQDTQVDKVREYWNNRPCNIRHSPKPLGTKEYFDEVDILRRDR